MNKRNYTIIEGIRNLLKQEDNLDLFVSGIEEFQGYLESAISSLDEELDIEANEYLNSLLELVEVMDEIGQGEVKPMFRPAITMEYFKSNNIDINAVTHIRAYFDIMMRFQEGIQCNITMELNKRILYHEWCIEDFLEDDGFSLDDYLRSGNNVTLGDLLTYFDEEVLKVFRNNNIIIRVAGEEYHINDITGEEEIKTGKSYDS